MTRNGSKPLGLADHLAGLSLKKLVNIMSAAENQLRLESLATFRRGMALLEFLEANPSSPLLTTSRTPLKVSSVTPSSEAGSENSESTESSETSEDSEVTESSEGTETKEASTEEKEDSEGSEDSESTEGSEGTESSETTEDSEGKEGDENGGGDGGGGDIVRAMMEPLVSPLGINVVSAETDFGPIIQRVHKVLTKLSSKGPK